MRVRQKNGHSGEWFDSARALFPRGPEAWHFAERGAAIVLFVALIGALPMQRGSVTLRASAQVIPALGFATNGSIFKKSYSEFSVCCDCLAVAGGDHG